LFEYATEKKAKGKNLTIMYNLKKGKSPYFQDLVTGLGFKISYRTGSCRINPEN